MKKKGLQRILVLTLIAVLAIGWLVAYRAVNRWYEPLRDPTKTVTYEMGQRVPIGPEPENLIKPEGMDGYSYRVEHWEIVDTDDYLQDMNLTDGAWQDDPFLKPKKLLLVTVTVTNENNGMNALNLSDLRVNMDPIQMAPTQRLCYDYYPQGSYPGSLSLAITEEATVTLPYALNKFEFSGRHWRNLEDLPFYMYCLGVNEGWEKRIVPLN